MSGSGSQRLDLPILAGERPRKKPRTVRRSTRSCSECKRRKIRCELSTDFNLTVCSACTQRGIPCVTQESQAKPPNTTKIDERLGRVETLLEQLVEKERSQDVDDRQHSSSPEDGDHGGRELLPQLSSNASHIHESGPHLSLFDNSVGRREVADPSQSPGQENEISPGKIPAITGSSRLGKIRQTLSALLPSQRDADLIAESTNGWVLFHVLCTASNDMYRNDDSISSFNLDAIAEREPAIIARTLLYIAICIQQLPPEFDTSSLQMCKQSSILDVAETYTSTVSSLVTTNDILSTTMPGLECLLLQGLFHMNAGHLQRSWITTRRALTVAQLLNLHSEYLKPLTEDNLMTQMANKTMWQKVVQVDRYLGMLMGLPCGTGDDCFGDHEESFTDLNKDHDDIFERKLCIIAGKLTKRNQIQDTKNYNTSQRIDERMDALAAHMSPYWWSIPDLPIAEKSSTGSGQFDRILAQMWFFQMKSFLHLPFLLREDQMYEYSRLSCVDASREIIFRYLALRKIKNTQLMCKVIDFGAFIACIILILDQIRSRSIAKDESPVSPEKQKDAELIQEIINSMERIARSEREVVVRESVIVMKALLDTNTSSKKLRLTIPYIGTISVLREPHVEQPVPPRDCSISSMIDTKYPLAVEPSPGNQSWQNVEGFSPIPYLSFDPSFEEDQMAQGWEPEPLEEIFFYSMMGSDVGGEWIF